MHTKPKSKGKTERLANIHPGKILLKEFMEPRALSQAKLAKLTGLTVSRVNDLIKEKRGITADSAIRLGRLFGVTPQFWINLQGDYDLEEALLSRAKDYASVKPLQAAKAA